jgi:hypothetical protein
MLGDYSVKNIMPFVVLGNFRLQLNMRGDRDTRDMFGLEGRPFWSRLDYPLSNPNEKFVLEEMV